MIAQFYEIDKWDGEKGCCPFHREKTSSFLWNKKNNSFHCFGCGKDFDIINFYQQSQGMNFIEAVNTLLEQTGHSKIKGFEFKEKDYFKDYRYPVEETNTDRTKVEKYLKKRAISEDTLDFCDIKQDAQGNVVFEHRDENGELLCTKYRPSKKVQKGQAKMWWQKNSSNCPILYGVNWIDITKPLIIVEGHVDVLAVIESGHFNVVSIPHGAEDTNWIEFNWEWLENFDKITLWFDDDKVGQKSVKEVVNRLGEYRCFLVEYPTEIKEKISEKFKGTQDKMDANNVLFSCGTEEVRYIIDNAKEIPIEEVIDVLDAEDFDPSKEPCISTGFNSVDRLIYGHFMNTINVWTGYTASGKTTAMLQSVAVSALESNEKVFVISGELIPGQVKNWLRKAWAGRTHILEQYNGEHKPTTYHVTQQAKNNIDDFYRGKIFIEKESLDSTPSHILSLMETMIRKKGTKVIILDNLMCVDLSDFDNENTAQKKFFLDLIALQRKYGVQLHICCHPRKGNGMHELNEYEILGSSNIPNLSHRIYAIRRVTESEKQDPDNPLSEYDNVITVLKDRLLGVKNKNLGLHYDIPSSRLYGKSDSAKKQYNWEKSSNIKYTGEILSKIADNQRDDSYDEVLGKVDD